MNPTPIEILRRPAPNQEAIDAESAEVLLATAPTARLQAFALRVEDWTLRRDATDRHASNPGGEEAAGDGERD